jgi:hypothetical protein
MPSKGSLVWEVRGGSIYFLRLFSALYFIRSWVLMIVSRSSSDKPCLSKILSIFLIFEGPYDSSSKWEV